MATALLRWPPRARRDFTARQLKISIRSELNQAQQLNGHNWKRLCLKMPNKIQIGSFWIRPYEPVHSPADGRSVENHQRTTKHTGAALLFD